MNRKRVYKLIKEPDIVTFLVLCMLLLSISFAIINMGIAWLKLNFKDVLASLEIMGDTTINNILMTIPVIFNCMLYFSYEKEVREKKHFSSFLIFFGTIILIMPFFQKKLLLEIVKSTQPISSIYIVISTIMFAFFIWSFGWYLVRLIVKFKTIIKDSNDRITITVAIVGTIISLIALFK